MILGTFLWPVEPLSVQAQYSKNLKNAPYSKIMSFEYGSGNPIAVDTLSTAPESEKTNKLIDDPDSYVH